jgi:hypothetical protein
MRAGKTSRNDGTLYSVFIYLAIIRLAQDLPFARFRQLVVSQDQTKLMVLLQFLFDADVQRTVRAKACARMSFCVRATETSSFPQRHTHARTLYTFH